MPKLHPTTRHALLQALQRLPNVNLLDGRTQLIANWPENLNVQVDVHGPTIVVLSRIIDIGTQWLPEPGIPTPLRLLIESAQELVQGSGLSHEFTTILSQIEEEIRQSLLSEQSSQEQPLLNQVSEESPRITAPINVSNGSVIFNQNQIGGQVAHSITNVGPQPRRVYVEAANILIADLRQHPPEIFEMGAAYGNGEAYEFALVLASILQQGGWTFSGAAPVVAHIMFSGILRNVQVETSAINPSVQALLNWLNRAGFKAQQRISAELSVVRITVGTNS